MDAPTDEQIKAEIAALREIKPRVRQQSTFGDNHHDAIDAQIEVLENRWDDSETEENYPDEGSVRDAALEACNWLQGGGASDSLVGDWKSLAS